MKNGPLALLVLSSTLCACTSTARARRTFEEHEAAFVAASAPTDLSVARGDHRLAVREYGARWRDVHPTVVLMQGFPDSMHLYDLVVPELAEERHVVTFDFLGWGASDRPRDHVYDFRSLDADLDAVIKGLALTDYVLVVHDISCPAGVDRTLVDPAVRRLVVLNSVNHRTELLVRPESIETFSGGGVWRWFLVTASRLSNTAWQNGVRRQLARFMVRDDETEKRFKDVFAHQALGIRRAFFELNSNLREEFERRAEALAPLARLGPRVALVFGDADPYLNLDIARELLELMPGATLEVVEGAGHYVQIDAPDRVAGAILRASTRR
ncbi:MAG: alpha/beta hydrolase [Planctomycetota bacterium]